MFKDVLQKMGPMFRDFLWKKELIRAAHPCMSKYVSNPLAADSWVKITKNLREVYK